MSQTDSTCFADTTPRLNTCEILLENILVAVDFSKHSTCALQQAMSVARCFGSELTLAHAATPAVYGTGLEPIPIAPYDMELETAHERLAELVHDTPALREFQHNEVVAYAVPADLVRSIANDRKIDLIVAGSHGASGLERLAIGSVAESILAAVPRPVMIVGPRSCQPIHPFRSILLATDLKTTGLRAAQYATFLAERFHAKLTLLHIFEGKQKHPTFASDLAEKNAREQLAQLLPPELHHYTTANLRVEWGKPSVIIPEVARAESASLIVTGFDDHSPLGDNSPWSTLSHVIRNASCPILCIRRNCV